MAIIKDLNNNALNYMLTFKVWNKGTIEEHACIIECDTYKAPTLAQSIIEEIYNHIVYIEGFKWWTWVMRTDSQVLDEYVDAGYYAIDDEPLDRYDDGIVEQVLNHLMYDIEEVEDIDLFFEVVEVSSTAFNFNLRLIH